MTRTSAALLAALLLASHPHTQAQTTKRTTKPATTAAKAAAPAPAPKADAPIERPFHSLAEIDQLTWWKMFNYIGSDAKTVYDETKSLNPKIEGTRWSYTLPFGLTPPPPATQIQITFAVTQDHRIALDSFPWGEDLSGGSYMGVGDPLAMWRHAEAKPRGAPAAPQPPPPPHPVSVHNGGWLNFKTPALYAAEGAMLLTHQDAPEKAAAQVQFYYAREMDSAASDTFQGAVETNKVPFGDLILITKRLENGLTVALLCAARPGNMMGTYSSSFDPSSSNSPIMVARTLFDWKRFVVVGVNFMTPQEESQLQVNGYAPTVPIVQLWNKLSVDHWTDTPQQLAAAAEAEAQAAAQQRQAEAQAAAKQHAEAQAAGIARANTILASAANNPVSSADLTPILAGKTVIPIIDLGFDGILDPVKDPNPQNVDTWVYPGGRVAYTLSLLPLFKTEAKNVRTFKNQLEFVIDKVDVKNDRVDVGVNLSTDPRTKRTIKFAYPGNGKPRPTNGTVLALVLSALTIK